MVAAATGQGREQPALAPRAFPARCPEPSWGLCRVSSRVSGRRRHRPSRCESRRQPPMSACERVVRPVSHFFHVRARTYRACFARVYLDTDARGCSTVGCRTNATHAHRPANARSGAGTPRGGRASTSPRTSYVRSLCDGRRPSRANILPVHRCCRSSTKTVRCAFHPWESLSCGSGGPAGGGPGGALDFSVPPGGGGAVGV